MIQNPLALESRQTLRDISDMTCWIAICRRCYRVSGIYQNYEFLHLKDRCNHPDARNFKEIKK